MNLLIDSAIETGLDTAQSLPSTEEERMEYFDQEQVVMVDASFEEIKARASVAVQEEIHNQMQQVTP